MLSSQERKKARFQQAGKASAPARNKRCLAASGENRLATNVALRRTCGFGNRLTPRRCAANLPRSHRLFHCKNGSEFKAPKTALSHGLTGFGAIKSGAKKRQISARGRSNRTCPQQMLACGKRAKNRLAANAALRRACGFGNWLAPRRCAANSPRSHRCLFSVRLPRRHRLFHCKNRSKQKAPKTAPSHGLTGFAAIKVGAKKRQISARGRSNRTRPQQMLACGKRAKNRLATNVALRRACGFGNRFALRRCAANLPRSHRCLFSVRLPRHHRPFHCKNGSK